MRARAAVVAFALTVAGGLPRILLAAGALPGVLQPFTWSDALLVYERGLSGHRLPYVDTPFEYPPLIGGLSALLSLVSTGPAVFVAAWVIIVAVAAAACAAMLASAQGWRTWAFAPQLCLLGTVNFDLVPTALVTAAVFAARRRRDAPTSFALGLGTLAKLYPLALAPLAFLRSRSRVVFVLPFIATLVAGYAPTSLQPYSSANGISFYAVGIRANLDSVGGIIERLLGALGVGPAAGIVVAASLVGLAVSYLFLVVPRARRASDPAVGFALATLTVLLWSRLYSPQYSLWVLPFFPLLDLARRRFVLLTTADVGVFLTIYPLTLVPWGANDPTQSVVLGALSGFVVLRHLALALLWHDVYTHPDVALHVREARGNGEGRGEYDRNGA